MVTPDSYFVVAHKKAWQDLLEADERGELPPSPRDLAPRIVNNEDCWVLMTFAHLRRRGLNVRLTDHFVPDQVCVASCLDFGIRSGPKRSLVIGCRGDGPRSALSDLQVVQNNLNVWSGRDFLIPLWPQPDLIARDSTRGDRIRNVVYKGAINNLHETFRSPTFASDLATRGIQLVVAAKGDRVSWGDYREADLVLAVRNLTALDARVKPASKLLNAWHAGVPALLGPEPAFRALRRSEADYIEVRTPGDALKAIDALTSDPARYRAMLAQAARRAPEFNEDAIAAQWIDLLRTAQRLLPLRERMPGSVNTVRFMGRAILQKAFNARALYVRTHGRRILDAEPASS